MMRLQATGFSDVVPPDYTEARRALSALIEPGRTFELRALPYGRSVVCTSHEQAVEGIKELRHAAGVYYTLNPCRADLDGAAKNKDITSRRWFLVDIDPERPRDTSATDEEKAEAKAVVLSVVRDLAGCGWPAPILIDSGNGYHALWRIDLPNDKLSQQWLKKALVALARIHDTARARVDQSVHNAARIAKLPGTWARKGTDSQDRPHRMARLLSVPETIETVSADLIKLIIDEPEPEPTTTDEPSRLRLRATDGSVKAYCRAALVGECTAVSLAPEGDRNNQLNVSAFKVGTLIHYDVFSREEAESALRAAARVNRLGDHETDATIRSGLDAGIIEPRDVPDAGQKARATQKASEPLDSLVIGLDQVEPKTVEWLWKDRIAVGFISLFAGRTGVGKSFVTCDFAARMSRGEPAPNDDQPLPPGRTLFISEDPVETMLAPRLLSLGAVPSMIKFMTWKAMARYSLGQLDMLQQAWNEAGHPALIVIDPPANFLSGKDEHKNAEVRQVVMNVVAWLDEFKVACVMITHINKSIGKGAEALDRVMGSVAWTTTSRVTLAFMKDPDAPTRCLFVGLKNNIGEKAPALSYEIVNENGSPGITWHGQVDIDADAAINGEKRKTKGVAATEWLTERFREKREWPSDDLKRAAREAGFDHNALWSPEAMALPIRKRPTVTASGDRVWHWVADPDWPPPLEGAETEGAPF